MYQGYCLKSYWHFAHSFVTARTYQSIFYDIFVTLVPGSDELTHSNTCALSTKLHNQPKDFIFSLLTQPLKAAPYYQHSELFQTKNCSFNSFFPPHFVKFKHPILLFPFQKIHYTVKMNRCKTKAFIMKDNELWKILIYANINTQNINEMLFKFKWDLYSNIAFVTTQCLWNSV